MSEEIAAAIADLAELARLRSELSDARAELAQQSRANLAMLDKLRTIERAIRAWADMSKHPPMDCDECEDLYRIANGTRADPLLAELEAARAVVAAARSSSNYPTFALTTAIEQYDEATKARG